MNQLYKPKSLNKEEIYRNFISIYYYLLFNEKSNNYYKKIIKYFYKEKTKLYQKFFYEHFLSQQNIFFFTLYNQIPLEFLPFPKTYFYFYYPIISLQPLNNKNKYYSENKIKLNNKLFNEIEVIDKNLFWEEHLKYYFSGDQVKKIKDIDNNIEGTTDTDIYDNFTFCFDINYLNLLSSNFFINKILFIFIDYPIITDNFKFDSYNKNFMLYEYYTKFSKKKYNYKKNNKIIQFKNIKYISIYDKITQDKINQCFTQDILKKNTYLYSQLNERNIHKYINNTSIKDMYWFNLTPFVRILDPLYLSPNEKYYYREYITNEDINLLNISSNIYVNNILLNENYSNFSFKNFMNQNINLIDYDIVNSTRKNTQVNYNKRNGLSFIIWKNKIYTDKKINFRKFLISFNIKSYFNLMSFVKLNNQIKFLAEELYLYNSNIKLVNNYTNDIKNFILYNQKDKYKDIYYKPI